MNNNKKKPSVCTTCLSFRDQRDSSFPVTEDIKEILRSLLYDFDIDAFFRSKPPNKEFALCETCHKTLCDMIAFKERILKSFNEFMKYWCVDEQQSRRNTVTAPSSSKTANVALIEVKYEESDPLEINKLHTEYIDIKEETDASHIYEETNINTKEFNEPEPVATIQLKHETHTEYNNAGTPHTENYTNNENVFNHNLAPVSYNAVQHSNEFIMNKVTATSKNSSDSYFDNHNVPSISKLNSFVKSFIVIPTNETIIQDTAIRVSNAASTSQNLNLTVGNNNSDMNSEVTSDVSHIKNTAIVTKSKSIMEKSLLDMLLETKVRNVKRESVDHRQVVVDNQPKIRKLVNIEINKGNIVSIGGGILDPISETKKDKSRVEQPSTANREPHPNVDLTEILEDDLGTASDTSATDAAEDSVHKKQPNMSKSKKVNKKWYIKVVTREEILKKMEERHSDPEFLKAPYKCDSCVTEFCTKELTEIHKETLHSKDSEFKCFACHSTFRDFSRLNSHYYVHMIDTCEYACATCEFETKYHDDLKDHVCPNAGCKTSPPKHRKAMKLTKYKSCYYCPKCEYLTTNSCAVVSHYNTVHTGNQKVKCGKCGKCYKNKIALQCHVRYAHRGRKPVREPVYCNICGKWYSDKTTHYAHMKHIHAGERKFECDECEKTFVIAASLKNHKEFHEALKGGVRNYQCSTCGSAYYTKKSLRNHVLLKHENKKTSRDHVCEVCGMAFFTGQMLREHSAKHSDERPYKCSYCGDTFKYTAALFTHTKLKHKKNKNSEALTQEEKSKETPRKDERTRVKKKKRVKRKIVDRSSSEEELSGFPDSWLNV